MTRLDVPRHRLYNQRIAPKTGGTPAEVVARLVGLQGQDYAGVKWSMGLRLPDGSDRLIEQAIADRTIVRTWPMRGTLHFVTARDVHWLLALTTPRVISRSASRYRQLELDATTFARSKDLFASALEGGRPLTRNELNAALERAGIATKGQRSYHLLHRAGMEGLLCFGPPRGKQQTFVLLDEWIPEGRTLAHDEALAELAHRYFTSRGPASLHDFVWWSGLTVAEARAGLEAVTDRLLQVTLEGMTCWTPPPASLPEEDSPSVHLLPGFDEYILGYTDRSAVLDPRYAHHVTGKNGIFSRTLVLDGRVMGTWKRTIKKDTVRVAIHPFAPLTRAETDAVAAAVIPYGSFLDRTAECGFFEA